MLFAVDPILTNSQVAAILEHSADDVNAATGCPKCALLRDAYSGWGRLDVAKAIAALAGPLPAPDRYEGNDDAGADAYTAWGKSRTLTATLDYYDDPVDVYRVSIGPHERLVAKADGSWPGAQISLTLWRPGTKRVETNSRTLQAARSVAAGAVQRVAYTARGRGWYYVEVKDVSPGSGEYTLTITKS
jgi:hypothetical protein